MSSKDSYNSDINKYEDIKVQIGRIVLKLNDSADAAGRLGFKITSDFKINNDGAAVGERAMSLEKKLNRTADYLTNTILPAIESAIGEAKQRIAQIEQEEAEASAAEAAAASAAPGDIETGVET